MVASNNPDKEALKKDLEDHDAKEEKEKTEAADEEEGKPSPTPLLPLQVSELCQTSPGPGKEQG